MRGLRLRLAALLVAIVAGSAAIVLVLGRHPSAPPLSTVVSPAPVPKWTVVPTTTPAIVARPVRVRIPVIGVNGPITTITTDHTGALVPPATTDVVGWFTGGPAPGDIGPALLAAHVDSRAGPGVFFRLVELRAGDVIVVDRADHTSVRFRVVSVARVAKTAFPTDLVYAPVPVPALRLITCGGAFDRSARSYRDNVIVEAAAL